jgi:CheY-like chemotaxis protein
MDLKSKHVLVLEDNPICRDVVEFALSSVGLNVTTATRSTEALLQARRKQFDLVITDYYLPDYPGTDFVRLLRESDHYRDAPIILLTGRADELDCQRLGSDLFLLVLSKECGSFQLLVAVFKCLAAVRAPTPASPAARS